MNLRTVIATRYVTPLARRRLTLAAIPILCAGGEAAGPIGQLPQSARFHWLVAPRSTIIQTSRVHTGICTNLSGVIERLLDTMVRPSPAVAR